MIEYQLGVIGAGNMAEAILRGIINNDCLPHDAIIAYDPVVTLVLRKTSAAGGTPG